VIPEEEVEWVRTQQDCRAGLPIATETGFRTWGTVSMISEIPVGWHTGEHAHGEEAIHIVGGEGFRGADELLATGRSGTVSLSLV